MYSPLQATEEKKHDSAGRLLRLYRQKEAASEAATAEEEAAEQESDSEAMADETERLKSQLDEAEEMIITLEEELEELKEDAADEIETYCDGKYTDEMRQCCISLLSLNVGVNNVGPVVTEVLKLANKRPAELPSTTLLKSMLVEGRAAGLAQIGEATELGGTSQTLHYGGTTKFGKKYQGFQLSTDEGQLTVSINDLMSGSAEHTLDLLKQVVEEISSMGEQTGRGKAGERLIASIRNTMTDRASVNTKFNTLLEGYRRDVLASTVEGWAELEQAEQAAAAKLNNHFCGLHMLVNLAEQCNSVLREFEASHSDSSTSSSSTSDKGECGTIQLIRGACKAFERHGSEQSGRMVDFATFANGKGIPKLPLTAFKGNRFNVLL